MSLPYAPFVDRQTNPVANQGGVFAGADYDMGARLTIQGENRDTPSLYGGAEDEKVWAIAPGELCYSATQKHGSSSGVKLSVLSALNGLGATASTLYPNEPEMVKEAVKNEIQFVGAAYQALSPSREDTNRGITVQLGGLKTLRMGVGEGDNFIKPGDLVCAEVPMPGRVYSFARGDSIRSATGRGVPPNKTTLQLRRCSTKTAGESLRLHIQQLLKNPQKWRLAMGERLLGTAVWATAAHEVMNSYLVGGLALVHALKSAGQISFTNARLPKDSTEVVAVLAASLGLIDGEASDVLRVRDRALNAIFYDGSNPRYEIGADINNEKPGDSSFAGRSNNREVNLSSPVGRLVHLQLTHFVRAVSGFHAAILNDLRFIVGKSTTGASVHGSNNAHVFMGIARQ